MHTNAPILDAARLAFQHLHGKRTPESAQPSIDLAHARRERLVGLLFQARPDPAWEAAAWGQARYTARCTALAEDLFHRLHKEIPDIALIKGPALARQAWPDPGLRSFDDLDFRCPRARYTDLCDVLLDAGCTPLLEDAWRQSHYWHYGWGIAFQHPDGVIVEINHRFFPPQMPWPRAWTLHEHALFQQTPLDSCSVRTPTPAFHLLLSCLHLFWHGGERIGWLADIAGLLALHPDAFQEANAWTTHSAMTRAALHTGVQLAETVFGPDIAAPHAPRANPKAAGELLHQLQTTHPLPAPAVRRLHRQLMPLPMQLAYDLRRLTVPGDGDFRHYHLPPRRRAAYWPLRIWRLAHRPFQSHNERAPTERA
jgi:hypothetical protein